MVYGQTWISCFKRSDAKSSLTDQVEDILEKAKQVNTKNTSKRYCTKLAPLPPAGDIAPIEGAHSNTETVAKNGFALPWVNMQVDFEDI